MSKINKETAISAGKQFASLVRSEIDNEAQVMLFGSCAKDEAHEQSDIDIAVVSKTFGNNQPENFAKLTLVAYEINVEIEPHPFSIEDRAYVTPFVTEIKKTGVVL